MIRRQQEIMDGAGIYRRLLGYVRPYIAAFALAMVGMVMSAATDTGLAAIMKPMLDGSFVDNDPFWIKMIPLLLLLLAVLRGGGSFLSSYLMAWIGRNVIKEMRRGIFHHYLHLPAAFFDHQVSGQLISKMSFDVEQVAQASTHAITVLVRDSLTVVGLLAWMFYLNWKLSLVFLIIGPLIAVFILYVNRRFRRISTNIQESMGDVTHVTEEAVDGHRIIKIFSGQDYEQRRFEDVNDRNRRQHMKLVSTSAASLQVTQFIAALSLAGIIYLATLEPMLDKVTVGTFMSFVVAMMMLLSPIKRLTTVNAMIQRGIAAAKSIFDLLDTAAEKDEGISHPGRVQGRIEFNHVSFCYEPHKGRVLEDIELQIQPGQSVAFVGHSGSGKTTLVSLLPRFYDIQQGSILLDGQDIRSLALSSLREQIALVGQHVTLFNDSIACNIAYGGATVIDRQRVIDAAQAAHAMEFIERLPEGLDTEIGENGVLLSGGQRQRIAIARALYKDAPILILDEATSALDSESERHIQAALEGLIRNRTTLVIAHRLSTIEQADLIVVMNAGRIVETGCHEALLSKGGHYAELHRLQFSDAATSPT